MIRATFSVKKNAGRPAKIRVPSSFPMPAKRFLGRAACKTLVKVAWQEHRLERGANVRTAIAVLNSLIAMIIIASGLALATSDYLQKVPVLNS